MIKIECSSYEKNELIRLLDYAKKQKKKEIRNVELLNYEMERINLLIERINGKPLEIELNKRYGNFMPIVEKGENLDD
jgi:hypothetical protein